MHKYIKITDPNGAEIGYNGPSVPIEHVIFYDGQHFHGYESSVKLFSSMESLSTFLTLIVRSKTSTSGVLTTPSNTEIIWEATDTLST